MSKKFVIGDIVISNRADTEEYRNKVGRITKITFDNAGNQLLFVQSFCSNTEIPLYAYKFSKVSDKKAMLYILEQ